MTNRNYTNDYLKILAAFGVVLIHTTAYRIDIYELEGFRWFANTVFRFAVPFFILSSGYYIKDNMKSLLSIVKLYVLVELIYSVATPFAIEHFGKYSIYKIEWYLPAMMIILVLTNNKSKWWTIFLVVISIFYSAALGRIWFIPKFVEFSAKSNWIAYIAIFLLGRTLRTYNFKINNRAINWGLLITAFLMCIYNGFAHIGQLNLFTQLTAIVFFVASLGISIPKFNKSLCNVSLDLFLFHGLFLPVIIFFDINNLTQYVGYVISVMILAITTGVIIRNIDKHILNGVFYSK